MTDTPDFEALDPLDPLDPLDEIVALDPLDEIKVSIADLETQIIEMKDRWLRAEAETANLRAQAQRTITETRDYSLQRFTEDMVDLAEMLHNGLTNLPPPTDGEPQGLRDGLAGVERNLLTVIRRHMG